MLKLIIEDDEGRKTVVPFVRDEITIGRLEGNTIRLTERNVSRRHARLLRQNGHVLVEDLGSYNGIRVNGDRIKGQVQVADGDLIQIGDYDLAIQSEEEKAAAPTVPLDAPTPKPGSVKPQAKPGGTGSNAAFKPTVKNIATSETMPSLRAVADAAEEADDEDVQEASDEDISPAVGEDEPPSIPKNQSTAVIRIDQVEGAGGREVEELDPAEAPRLVAISTEFAGREFPLVRTEMRIGRVDDNDIAIDHRSLSRTHCKVVREASGEWKVIDLQSANGIMVNGEQYAQSTLSPGDVLELGHLKLKFALAGEAVEIPTSSSSPTGELEPASGGSKAPLIALAATVVVLVAGGGGYVFWKSRQTVEPVKPPPKPLVTQPDQPDTNPTVTPEEDPEAIKAANEQRLTDAQESIEAMDFITAESLLKQTTVDGKLHPQAKKLIEGMELERGKLVALQNARDALDANDLDKARTNLDAASGAKLLAKPYAALQAQYSEAVKKVVANNTVKPNTPPKPDPDVARRRALEAELNQMMDDAREDLSAKRYKAAVNKLEGCVKKDPDFAECHMLLGSSYARLGSSESDASAVAKGLQHYREFLRTAPPDHPKRSAVQNIIDNYEQQKKNK